MSPRQPNNTALLASGNVGSKRNHALNIRMGVLLRKIKQ